MLILLIDVVPAQSRTADLLVINQLLMQLGLLGTTFIHYSKSHLNILLHYCMIEKEVFKIKNN